MNEPEKHVVEGIGRVLRERRTVHDFTAEIPPEELLRRAVDLGRWAPNHLRTEPWHFYLLDQTIGHRIADLNAGLVRATKGDKVAGVKQRRWAEMPGWMVVTSPLSDDKLREREDYAACCCAVHNVSLYLWEHGVGMKWTTGAVTRDPRFFDIVGIDCSKVTVVGLFWYGYPVTVPVQHRKAVDEVLTRVVADA
jgi:nitroreductase